MTLMNSYIDVEGAILFAFDPLDLHLENLEVNLTRSSGGFDISIDCSDPNAYLDGLIYINNFWHYFREGREEHTYEFHIFSHMGPAKVQSSNVVLEANSNIRDMSFTFAFYTNQGCIPDYEQRQYSFTNTTIKMNGSASDMILLAWIVAPDIYTKNIIDIDGLTINVVGSFFPVIYARGFYLSEMNMSNVNIANSSFTSGFLTALTFEKLAMSNIQVESTSLVGTNLIGALYFNQYSLTNMTMNNFTAIGSAYISAVSLIALPYATTSLSN